VRAALEDGMGSEEIKEVLLQVAIYAGVPAANSAFAVAQRTIAQHSTAQYTTAETSR
jgi:alkylhydroperoxidase/carboxymuconolactone decarboxylase family protein YurZ